MSVSSCAQNNASLNDEAPASSPKKMAIILSRATAAEVAEKERYACLAYCEAHGYDVAGEKAITGHHAPMRHALSAESRPAVAAHGEERVYVGYGAMRLFSSPEDLDSFIEVLSTEDATLETVKEGALTPGSLEYNAAIAKINYRVAKRAMSAAIARLNAASRKEHGGLAGRPPLGFIAGKKETGEYTCHPDPAKSDKVIALFEKAVDGASRRELTIFADYLGLKAPNGTPLSPDYILRILRNPVYAGLIKSGDGEGYVICNVIGIISEELFQLVQVVLDEMRKGRGSK